MGIATTINGFNVGTDVRFVVQDSFGDVFSDAQLGHLASFDSKSDDVMAKITPITTGGVPIYQTLWNGVSGSMKFIRVGPSFQQLFMDLQAAYFNSGVISQMTIAASVRNRDSSIDEYLFTGVQFMKPNFGSFTATKEVDMSVGFSASLLQATGTLSTFLSALAAV
jgi:hypothetical protein